MRVFFNHIHKTGGTSLEYLLENDSDLKFTRVRANSTSDDLQKIANQYSEGNMIIQGHKNEPFYEHCPYQVTEKFWDFIYKNSDIKFSILRHPIDRALSYVRYSGFNDSESLDRFDPGFFYKYVPIPKENHKSTKLFQTYERYHMQIDSIDLTILKNILPDKYKLSFPECQNLALALNEYPIALFSGLNLNEFLIPNSLRENKFPHESYFKNFHPFHHWILEYLKIPDFHLLAFEDLECVFQWLKHKKIIRGNIELPHLNKTKLLNEPLKHETDELEELKCVLASEYPESFYLWKLAAMRHTLRK